MPTTAWTKQIATYDERRNVALPGNAEETLSFCVEHFVGLSTQAIEKQGSFFVALSGGSTPKVLFERLTLPENRDRYH